MDGLQGWQLAAARAACAMSYRDVAAQSGVATSTLTAIEKMAVIEVQREEGRRYGGVLASTLSSLVECFAEHGIELRGASAGKPAAVVCVDVEKLNKRRKKEFKGRERERAQR